MCIALSKEACAAASAAFQNHSSGKFYLALVRGHVSQVYIQINIPVGEESQTDEKVRKIAFFPKDDNLFLGPRGLM